MDLSKLKRSKSECDVVKLFGNHSSRQGIWSGTSERYSEIGFDGNKQDVFANLENKIDKLTDMFQEQCRLMTEIKDELVATKTVIERYERLQNELLDEMLKNALSQRSEMSSSPESEAGSSRAHTLLKAIEMKHMVELDTKLKESLLDMLHSDELKERVVSMTADSVQASAAEALAIAADRCRPMLTHAHRRLAAALTHTVRKAFVQLESHSAELTQSVCRASQHLLRALDRHRYELEDSADSDQLKEIIQESLEKELKQFRKLTLELGEGYDYNGTELELENEVADSPTQPPNPHTSATDQLMKTAIIRKRVADGKLNLAFLDALSASDLSMVVAACRAAAPASVRRLHRPLLLALAQQLPTDMVHDTQLKCRYLEEIIINLEPTHPEICTYLPLIVAEMRKNLNMFLAKYPGHVASRRIGLIIMAADQLLK